MDNHISVIIVNYNGLDFLAACLASLKKVDYDNFEIIIIDNNSTDGSAEWLAKHQNDFRLIKNKKNLGFAVANNSAAGEASGKYLFFLNNDTKVDKNILRELVSRMESDERIGVCGCNMRSYDGLIDWHTGVGLDIFGYPIVGRQVFYAEGSAMMIRRDLFEKLSGFDEKYFMFHEDIDFCWRVKLMGYAVAAEPKAIFYHFIGGAAGGRTKKEEYTSTYFRRTLAERNNIRTLIKNYRLISLLLILPVYLAINLAEIFVFLIFLKFKIVNCYLKSWWWNIENVDDSLRQRRQVQSLRKVSDREILKEMYWGSGKFLILKKIGLPKLQ